MSDVSRPAEGALRVLALIDDFAHYTGRVRINVPLNSLREQRVISYQPMSYMRATDNEPGANRVFTDEFLNMLSVCDVVVWSLVASQVWLKYMHKIQEAGIPFVMDFDDDLWSVSPFSNSFGQYGTFVPGEFVVNTASEGLEYKAGDKVKMWDPATPYSENGKLVKFDPEGNQKRLAALAEYVKRADAITTTTEVAAERFREWNDNVHVLPNCLEGRTWQYGKMERADGMYRIGWYGGASHKPDLIQTGAGFALGEFAKRHPDVRVVVAGVLLPEIRHYVPLEQIEFHEWVCADAHPFQVRCFGLDHGLVPIADMKFNLCKSAIKWTEMSACGIPVSASNHTPYSDAIEDGVDGWLIDDGWEGWLQHMEDVYSDPESRLRVGQQGRLRFMKDYEIHDQSSRWMEAYSEVVTRGVREPAPQSLVLDAAGQPAGAT